MRVRARNAAMSMVLRLLRLTLGVLSRVVPQRRSVVLSVHPETEGNGLEVARALVSRYDGRVVWLQEQDVLPEVEELVAAGMELVPKASLAGLVHYLRAEAVLFTHGLYGSPKPCARKPIVNLWHGDGPKDLRPDDGIGGLISSTWFVGSTRLFSRFQGEAFGIPEDRLLLTGNPRTDQLWHSVDPAQLADLGITGGFVVWMPTFRRTKAVGAMPATSEVGEDGPDGAHELDALMRGLRERGLQLVIKPHPLDAESRLWEGAVTLTDADLVRAGVSLYTLLGQSSGLVTDYSSVWVDYLLLDRPMAFLVQDRDSYSRTLLPPDVLDWAPGELVGESPFAEFLADLDADGALGAMVRKEVAERIELNPTHTSAADLLDELANRGILRLDPAGLSRRRGFRQAQAAVVGMRGDGTPVG